MKRSNPFDLRDWSIRRGMVLTAALLSVSIAAAIGLSLRIVSIIAIASLLLLLIPQMRRVVPLFCVVIVLLGLGRGATYRIRTVEPMMQIASKQDSIEGIVEECPKSGHMYIVRVTQSDHLPPDSRILLYCSDQVAPSLNDVVSSVVEYKDLYSRQKYYRADGVLLQAYPTTFDENSVLSRPSGRTSWRTALRPLREKLTDALVSVLNADEGGLLAGVCFGDRSRVADHVADVFRASGLSHLLSVSGLHMSVIAAGMILLMRTLRVKQRIGNVITAVVIVLFMWIVEFTPSVTRAGIMYLTLIIGQMFRYRSDSLNSLGLALTLILVISPSSLYDVGLWLSFAAVVGILCVTPRIKTALCRPFENLPPVCAVPARWVINSISISVGCTLPVMPLLLTVFGEISLVSPIANLFAVLPAGWMTILGCLGALLSLVPGISFVGYGMIMLAGLLAKWIIAVSTWCSLIPGALLRPTEMWMIILLAGGGVLVSVSIMLLTFRRACAVLCTMLSALIVLLPIGSRLNMNTVTLAIAADKHGTIVVAEHESKGIVLINDVASLYTASTMLDDLRVSQPQLLIVANCRTQHESILAEWRRDYSTLEIVSGDDVGVTELVDYPIAVSDSLRFWDDCSIDIVSDDSWLLSIGDTRLLIALSQSYQYTDSSPPAQALLLYEAALRDCVTIDADAVFYVADDSSATTDADGLYRIEDEKPEFLVTNGDGVWRRPWRVMYVLE